MHSNVVDQFCKCLAGTEGQGYLGLVPDILYGEEILHLYQNMINFLFMVGMWDVIGPGTQHEKNSHEVRQRHDILPHIICILVSYNQWETSTSGH